MKTILLVLILLPFISFSQSVSSIGIKGGCTLTHVPDITKTTPGYDFGLVYSHTVNKFQIGIEPSIIQNGFSIPVLFLNTDSTDVKIVNLKYRYTYFNVPITFGWLPLNKRISFGTNIGLAPGFLLIDYNRKNATIDNYISTFHTTPNKFSLNFLIGVKVGAKISERIYVAANLRFYRSLKSVWKPPYPFRFSYFNPFLEIGYRLNKTK